jgi:hypothetical protein
MGWRSWNGPVDKEVMIETLTWPMERPGSGGGGELLVRWKISTWLRAWSGLEGDHDSVQRGS